MSIRREDLTPEWLARTTKRIRDAGFQPLTDEEREASVREVLARAGRGRDVWVFGYGSLMWNPMVRFREQHHGLLYGYHRRFCFWVRSGRGSPEMPGLMLGLDRGGSCRGMVFCIPAAEAEAELTLLWMREMISGIYTPRWVTAHTPRGKIQAVTFVVDRSHRQYIRELPPEQAATHIARAKGWLGSCRTYLENTIAHLAELGFTDRNLSRLHALVRCESGE
jgi:cation transport protein ChaC